MIAAPLITKSTLQDLSMSSRGGPIVCPDFSLPAL